MSAVSLIERPVYLNELIRKKEDGRIKIVTGMRRTGKSYLLFEIYHAYLLSTGVDEAHIIGLSLEDDTSIEYRNPLNLGAYIRSRITDDGMYYIILDEIQKVSAIPNPHVPGGDPVTFVDVLLGLMKIRNADIYVTGSNSRMLSTDILTEFRGRGEEIRVRPLSYREFLSAYRGERNRAWSEYCTYGGLPLVLAQETHEDKARYLQSVFDTIYISDILSRYSIGHDRMVIDDLLSIAASSVGSLTSPLKLSNVFRTEKKHPITDDTVARYLGYLTDAFILAKAQRYNVKGKKYISSPAKYYYSDLGLRNARLNFRQQEPTHIMENIIYNELLFRGFSVDVGIVDVYGKENGKTTRKSFEVDFVANSGSRRYYIQSAMSVGDPRKLVQETRSLNAIQDSFRKIVVVADPIIPWHDDSGTLFIGIEQFLLEDDAMDR